MGMFEGKVALVTGAGGGLGAASALAFAQEGARVVVADVNVTGGRQTVQTIEKAGGKAIFVKADVSNEADVKALVAKTIESYGRLDCAHNNAGVEHAPAPLTELTEESWDRTLKVNLKGVWLCLKYEIPQMVKNGGGAIVNTSSVAGLHGTRQHGAYGASKWGVISLTKTAALENGGAGVRVNAVCPGAMSGTAMWDFLVSFAPDMPSRVPSTIPLGRTCRPEEIAQTVIWLCSGAAAYVTGHAMVVDGGSTAH
jgi:NAD(P)-dependent dehydrogenase (short-subunit alcohol dehydrogenase family)